MNAPHDSLRHDPHDPDHDSGEPRDPRHERLCAFLFGELDDDERRAILAELQRDPELRAERARLEATLGLIERAIPEPELSPAVQETLRRAAERLGKGGAGAAPTPWSWRLLRGGSGLARLAAAALVVLGGGLVLRAWLAGESVSPAGTVARRGALEQSDTAVSRAKQPELESLGYAGGAAANAKEAGEAGELRLGLVERRDEPAAAGVEYVQDFDTEAPPTSGEDLFFDEAAPVSKEAPVPSAEESLAAPGEYGEYKGPGDSAPPAVTLSGRASAGGGRKRGYGGVSRATGTPAETALPPASTPATSMPLTPFPQAEGEGGAKAVQQELANLPPASPGPAGAGDGASGPLLEENALEALRALGYAGDDDGGSVLDEVQAAVSAETALGEDDATGRRAAAGASREALERRARAASDELVLGCRVQAGERPADMFLRYFGDHPFVATEAERLSTFAADVDTASYGLARRTLRAGRLPPPEQGRTEEFVNAFRPDFPAPARGTFALGLELAPSRFGPDRNTWMLRAVVRAREVDALERQPVALTFVVDVSGSMDEPDRLPLVKSTLRTLLAELDAADSVALVAFRESATVVSEMVSAANQRGQLEDALAGLDARGGTSVEAGLLAGLELAARALTPHAVNRVVLLSDGVGNIGETDQARILSKVEELRAAGLYLNTVGVGLGDHHDAFLEQLADRGDGLCGYVDSEESARRALVEDFTGAFQPIARDVKLQLEFDPAAVESFRQLGYENRALAHADFKKDEVDAGEVNAGHQVTALYELRLRPGAASTAALATLRVRHKPPFAIDRGDASARAGEEAEVAQELQATLTLADAAMAFDALPFGYRRAVLVAQLAEHLRRSVHAHDDAFGELVAEARRLAPLLRDPDFDELLELLDLAQPLLAAERAQEDPELYALSRELCELRYRQAHRELVHGEVAEDDLAAENRRIAELEELVRQSVRTRCGLPQVLVVEEAGGER